jgi:hypothetical protein
MLRCGVSVRGMCLRCPCGLGPDTELMHERRRQAPPRHHPEFNLETVVGRSLLPRLNRSRSSPTQPPGRPPSHFVTPQSLCLSSVLLRCLGAVCRGISRVFGPGADPATPRRASSRGCSSGEERRVHPATVAMQAPGQSQRTLQRRSPGPDPGALPNLPARSISPAVGVAGPVAPRASTASSRSIGSAGGGSSRRNNVSAFPARQTLCQMFA